MGQGEILKNEISLNKANEFVCLSMTRFIASKEADKANV
jgi:hypothetical protein